MMDRTILIVGDSLGLPRENMAYKKTWPYRIAAFLKNHHVVMKIQRALTTEMINTGTKQDWLEFYSPQDVMLQVGIVDCAPRYIKNGGLTMKLLGVSPSFVKSNSWKLIKKYGARTAKHADVSIDTFKANLKKYIQRCEKSGAERIFLIKIAKPGSAMVKLNPGVLRQTELYNKVFDEVAAGMKNCIIIDTLAKADDSYFLEDGYHLNEYGNEQLFNSIIKHYN